MSCVWRRVMFGATGVLWVLWGAAEFVAFAADHEMPPWHLLGTQALRACAGLCTIWLMLSFLVAPMIQTAKVWHEIGLSKREPCSCETPPREVNARVLPFKR